MTSEYQSTYLACSLKAFLVGKYVVLKRGISLKYDSAPKVAVLVSFGQR